MFTTLSTILFPITTGLSLSLLLGSTLCPGRTELTLLCAVPLDVRLLEGEQDWRLGFPLELGSTEDDLALGAPGLPREAEAGL